MGNWVVIKDEKLFEGPFGWNSRILNNIFKNLGYNISFSNTEPVKYVKVSDAVRILPMVAVCPPITALNVMNPTPIIQILEDKITYTYSVRDKTPDELNPPENPPPPVSEDTLKQWALENKYLEATKSLIQLAGQTPSEDWPKLEDVEYEQIALAAVSNNVGIATLLLSTVSYTFFQLKLLKVEWEDIIYHELPV